MNTSLKCALLAAALASSTASHAELAVGAKAPEFTAPAYLAGAPFTYDLAEALRRGPVVLYFFPAAFTPGCNIEAHLFSEAIGAFQEQGATVIGVTAGNTDRLAEFSRNTEYCAGRFPVAADEGARIAAQYDATLALKPGWSDRTSYVIAPDGSIAHVYSAMSPNGHVRETLAAVRALADKH